MEKSEIPKVEFRNKQGISCGFEIMKLEDLFARQLQIKPPITHPHRVQFHNILYIAEGEGTHQIDFKDYSFQAGSLIFISKGQVHAFAAQQKVRGYILLFTTEYLEKNLIHSDVLSLYRLYSYQQYGPVVQPEDTLKEGVHDLVDNISKEYDGSVDYLKDEILRLYLKTLLLKTERIQRTVTTDQKNAAWLLHFGQFNEFLELHIASTRSVKSFAAMLNISTKHLNTICKAVAGVTAKQYIDNCMVLEMKRLLATSDNSVQEISYDFGFGESTNFVKYFKKHSGISPSQFRKTFTR